MNVNAWNLMTCNPEAVCWHSMSHSMSFIKHSGTKSPNLASPFAAMWGFTPSPEIASIVCILLALVCENDAIETPHWALEDTMKDLDKNVDGC